MSLADLKKHWEELATIDPMWAIFRRDGTRFGKWNVEEFFRTGVTEIDEIMAKASELGYPKGRARLLDFGCGVGRTTRPFTRHFEICWGVDISEKMIETAKKLNVNNPTCKFSVNVESDLRVFPDNYFDMIYSNTVLQHLTRRSLIRSYVSEFVRILKPQGLIVFQLPHYIPMLKRIELRRWLYLVLRRCGFESDLLYSRVALNPMHMTSLPESEVVEFLADLDSKVLRVEINSESGPVNTSRTYYATKF
jgi:SAM-dependent methyltransferase